MPSDEHYLNPLLARIEVSKHYKPKFGQGTKAGLSLVEFETLYGSDPFYTWFGLDTPLMYAAHRAAGGITSVYRQIGIACEALIRQIIQDQCGLTAKQTQWSYSVATADSTRQLSLDARIDLAQITVSSRQTALTDWMREAAASLSVASEVIDILKGAVFEVRQGYKSKDSKRQNADIANAVHAYSQGYLPVVAVLSGQIDNDLVLRYRNVKWLVLRGYAQGTSLISVYSFMRDVIGYDLAAFFERHAQTLKTTILEVLETLLSAE